MGFLRGLRLRRQQFFHSKKPANSLWDIFLILNTDEIDLFDVLDHAERLLLTLGRSRFGLASIGVGESGGPVALKADDDWGEKLIHSWRLRVDNDFSDRMGGGPSSAIRAPDETGCVTEVEAPTIHFLQEAHASS